MATKTLRVNGKAEQTKQTSTGDIELQEPTGGWTIEADLK